MILVTALLITTGYPALATSEEIVILSDLSDDACIAFIKEQGVSIPSIYEEEIMCVPFVRSVIEKVEANPNAVFIFDYHVLEEFANAIKAAVISYYGITDFAICYTVSSTNILQDNTVVGNWSASYTQYRCYSYVMGYTYYVQPGEIEWRNNGLDPNKYVYNYSAANVVLIANRVEDDLVSLGYTVITNSNSMPDTIVSEHTHLICVRKGTGEFTDYHFMKLSEDGYWYHKPGQTNPLRYKYTPSNDRPWVVEGYDGVNGVYVRYEDYVYDSEIYYIEYTTPHEWEYVYCNSSQHIKTCTICGETNGSVSACIYINNTCKFCGNYNGYIQLTPSKRTVTAVAVTE